MRLKLNISPCPNDTFMFDAIINHRIDCQGFEFETTFADIDDLNKRIQQGGVDVSKISYAVLPCIESDYKVLDSGSALGWGNGPVFVSKNGRLGDSPTVAIPGEQTTANMLLKRLYPAITNKKPMLFSEIGKAILVGDCDAGVLIHEERFTYMNKGLKLIADLGEEWERQEGVPLPLGAIVASRALSNEVQIGLSKLIKESILFAMANPMVSREFIKQHAQEVDDAVIDSHIKLFVNEYSLSLGDTGRMAVNKLLGSDY